VYSRDHLLAINTQVKGKHKVKLKCISLPTMATQAKLCRYDVIEV